MLLFVFDHLIEGLASTLLSRVTEETITHRRSLKSVLAASTIYRSRKIRVSFAELLLIKKESDFILIRSERRRHQFGPIGGVIRYFPSAERILKDKLNFTDFILKEAKKRDLRGFIKGKDFPALLRWFYSQKHREMQALGREVEEELMTIGLSNLLKPSSRLQFELKRVVHEGPTSVRGTDYMQYRLFHVYELNLTDAKSRKFASSLTNQAKQNPHLMLASADDIKRGRGKNGELIGDHSGYLFGEGRVGNEPPPY